MYVTDAEVERVYQFIWNYVTEREELQTARQATAALQLPQEDVLRCVGYLRGAGRISKTTLMPTAFFRSRKVM